MTNLQIIELEKQTRNITKDVNTYGGWKKQGYKVKKGSKATFQTKIWKPVKRKPKDKKTEDKQENKKDKKVARFYLVKAYFFTQSQVEPITD